MNTLKAYDLVLKKVEELKQAGIKVKVKPCPSAKTNKIIPKPSQIPAELWEHIRFEVNNLHESRMVLDAANYLDLLGIYFDSGGEKKYREWELDWSFEYTGIEGDGELRELRESVEECLNKE